jgi:protein phosphatase
MLDAFGATDKGCVRPNNEDSFLVEPKLGVFLVADGMGGAAAGETASKLAVDTLREVCEEVRDEGMNAAKLVSAFHEANRRIKLAVKENARLEGMGTTMVAAIEAGSELLIASVGDSRAYRYNAGQIEQITEDQSWVQEVGRKLQLPEEALRVHPYRHMLTMAVGVSDPMKVNSYSVTMDASTVVLLASDGLHGIVPDFEIANILGRPETLEVRANALIESAKAHGGPDNVTVVLVRRS